MQLDIDGLQVYFPYEYIYPEQYEYMKELKKTLDVKGHCLLEMPTGTGKTVSLLSLITSYQLEHPDVVPKLIYCTRTIPELVKCLGEMKRVIAYRDSILGDDAPEFVGLGLSSRKQLCINDSVIDESNAESLLNVDNKCRNLTASWIREQAKENSEIPTCGFYSAFEDYGQESVLPSGVYSLQDLKDYGSKHNWCPYFTARHAIAQANVIVFSYQYVLDPKIANLVTREIDNRSVVVFDEAHNIDNVCLEALSLKMNSKSLRLAGENVKSLLSVVEGRKQANSELLQREYRQLVDGLNMDTVAAGGVDNIADQNIAQPVFPNDMADGLVPGSIRQAGHFLRFCRRLVQYFKERLGKTVLSQNPKKFLLHMRQKLMVDERILKSLHTRLGTLFQSLELVEVHKFLPLQLVIDFCTVLSSYKEGFQIIVDPLGSRFVNAQFATPQPCIQLVCLDPSLVMSTVFERFQSVVLTSGTLSPLDMYQKMLGFKPYVARSIDITMSRKCILPLFVSKGNDQTTLTSRYEDRTKAPMMRNYGELVIELCNNVPDGVICFFPSYRYLEEIIGNWHDTGILVQMMRHKLVFIETRDSLETTLALTNYRKACDSGKGAIMFCVARGKVAEGVDFTGHHGRCVISLGIPFQHAESHVLRERLDFLKYKHDIQELDFLRFDALREVAQCVGRALRSKADYAIMVFADKRFCRADCRKKLPPWIQHCIDHNVMHLSTDLAISMSKKFLLNMSQPRSVAEMKSVMMNAYEVQTKAQKEQEEKSKRRTTFIGSAAEPTRKRGRV